MGTLCGNEGERNNGSVNDKLLKNQSMMVYGDWFDADTRTVMTLLKLGNVTHTFK